MYYQGLIKLCPHVHLIYLLIQRNVPLNISTIINEVISYFQIINYHLFFTVDVIPQSLSLYLRANVYGTKHYTKGTYTRLIEWVLPKPLVLIKYYNLIVHLRITGWQNHHLLAIGSKAVSTRFLLISSIQIASLCPKVIDCTYKFISSTFYHVVIATKR